MDDDITFGASVWGTSDTLDDVLPLPKAETQPYEMKFDNEALDEFDEFTVESSQDDDFGDFEDFNEQISISGGFDGDIGQDHQTRVAGPSREWHPLRLNPTILPVGLEEEIYNTVGPLWENENISAITTIDQIREVEGVGQILMTPESRELFKLLTKTPPPTKPPNWTRSRIRRQHLITLGIPVNLDEVLPRVTSTQVPPLEIHTRPMSAPPGHRNPDHLRHTNGPNPRSGTPQPREHNAVTQFGNKPEIDRSAINSLLELEPETLSMKPLSSLERYLDNLKTQTANTSRLLTHLLQVKDALQQDSEMYNGLIGELVGEAQKIKSGKPRIDRT